jgi:hypothetical protein
MELAAAGLAWTAGTAITAEANIKERMNSFFITTSLFRFLTDDFVERNYHFESVETAFTNG